MLIEVFMQTSKSSDLQDRYISAFINTYLHILHTYVYYIYTKTDKETHTN